MGCWNKTCGLSSLHIYAGTPVYVFVMEDERDYSNCYSTSLFSPLLLPFDSEYNDYGGGENSKGIAFDLIMAALKNKLVEMPLGENQYHDIAVTREDFGEELFFNAVHEDRMYIRDLSAEDNKRKVTFTMFRKDIVDTILDRHVIEQYVGNGEGTCGWNNNYIQYKFADIVANIRPLLERIVNDASKASPEVRFYLCESIYFKLRNEYLAARWIGNDSYRYSRLVDIRGMLGDTLHVSQAIDFDYWVELLTAYIKGTFIDAFMHSTRKTWIPGGHEGSQHAGDDEYRLLAAATIEALDREKAEFDSDE